MASLTGILGDKTSSAFVKVCASAVSLPGRQAELPLLHRSRYCGGWAAATLLSSHTLSELGSCFCASISSSRILGPQLRVSFVFSSRVRWPFQGRVYGANPVSWLSLPLRQQPEVHLDNRGQPWEHCQVGHLTWVEIFWHLLHFPMKTSDTSLQTIVRMYCIEYFDITYSSCWIMRLMWGKIM